MGAEQVTRLTTAARPSSAVSSSLFGLVGARDNWFALKIL